MENGFRSAMPRYDFHYPLFMKVIEREDLIDDERFYPQKNLQSHLEEFYKILDAEIGKYTLGGNVQKNG